MSSLALRLDKTGVCVPVRAYAPMLLCGSVGSQPGSCRAREPAPEAGSRVEVGVTAVRWSVPEASYRPVLLGVPDRGQGQARGLNSLGLP